MAFIGSLAGVIVFSVLFRIPLKRFPSLFYVIALLVSLFYLFAYYIGISPSLNSYFNIVMQKGTLAMSFLMVVMFMGVFRDDSQIRRYLMPIRGELSIIGSLLAIVHVVRRLTNYLVIVFYGAPAEVHIIAAFWISLIVFALLIILTVTSFNIIGKRMKAIMWKRVQRLAYPFMFFTYLHILLFLIPPALLGGTTALVSAITYTVVFFAYAALRIRAHLIRNRARQESFNLEPAVLEA